MIVSDIELKPKWWMFPIQFVVILGVSLIQLPGTILAPFIVPFGLWFNWPKWTWLWSNMDVDKGEPYADDFWYKKDHWSWKLGDKFAQYWWMAVRNSFSNGARYMMKPSPDENIWWWPGSHKGFTKLPYRWAFKGIPQDQWTDTLFVYKYDYVKWWKAEFVYSWFINEDWYFQIMLGFKFSRTEGEGCTFRIWVYQREDK